MRLGRWSGVAAVVVAGALAAPGAAAADKGGVPHAGSNGVGRDGARDEAPAAQSAPAAAPAAAPAEHKPEMAKPKHAKHAKRAHPARPAEPDHPAHPAKSSAAPAAASAPADSTHHDNRNPGKTTICHHTGSATNPWVTITIADRALKAHARHGDLIPAPAGGCPAPSKAADAVAEGTKAALTASSATAPTVAASSAAAPTPGAPATTAASSSVPVAATASSTASSVPAPATSSATSETAGPRGRVLAESASDAGTVPSESAPTAAARAGSGGGSLAYTGFRAALIALLGAGALLAGVALRRSRLTAR